MQQPGAKPFGFGDGQLAVQQQGLQPAGEVLGGQDQFQPDGVASPGIEGQVGQAGGLGGGNGGADAVFDAGVLAVAQLQAGEVAAGLAGEKDLVAAALSVGEAAGCLGAGVGTLAAAETAGAGREAGLERSSQPVTSATQAPSRGRPSAAIAGRQACSGRASRAWPTWASIANPTENCSLRARSSAKNAWVAPALSVRTSRRRRTRGGSCASASSSRAMCHRRRWRWRCPVVGCHPAPRPSASPRPSPRSR